MLFELQFPSSTRTNGKPSWYIKRQFILLCLRVKDDTSAHITAGRLRTLVSASQRAALHSQRSGNTFGYIFWRAERVFGVDPGSSMGPRWGKEGRRRTRYCIHGAKKVSPPAQTHICLQRRPAGRVCQCLGRPPGTCGTTWRGSDEVSGDTRGEMIHQK